MGATVPTIKNEIDEGVAAAVVAFSGEFHANQILRSS